LLSNTPNLSHFVTGQVPHPQTCWKRMLLYYYYYSEKLDPTI
jgi:hypothetical protein